MQTIPQIVIAFCIPYNPFIHDILLVWLDPLKLDVSLTELSLYSVSAWVCVGLASLTEFRPTPKKDNWKKDLKLSIKPTEKILWFSDVECDSQILFLMFGNCSQLQQGIAFQGKAGSQI